VVLAVAAVLSATVGMLIEPWLFFAEAKHVVMLYYGEHAA
jgi:DMSO reductase anchor subunit